MTAAPIALAIYTANERIYYAVQSNAGYFVVQATLTGANIVSVAPYAQMPDGPCGRNARGKPSLR